jgi:Ca2+:H+ antiporter
MDLLFTVFELVAIAVAVLSIAFIAHDGETHWMEGVQLLAVYVILALGVFFLPVQGDGKTLPLPLSDQCASLFVE